MRRFLSEVLGGLTVRGRAFIAAGLSAIVCAMLLGQPALTRVGALVVLLPLLSAVITSRTRGRFSLARTVTPQLVEAGQTARVDLRLVNEGRAPSGVLLLEEHLPYVLGNRPRFVLEGMSHGWQRHVGYQVRSDVRGRFEIGPMSVRVGDLFGLVELGRSFRTTVPLVVTPRVLPLPPITISGVLAGSGDNRPRAFTTGSSEDVTVRQYRQGDDLRRVHWRSSARVGELMVRREEQPWQSRATVFLDNREVAHHGRGVASSLEAAVSAAASIAAHLTSRGYAVRLVTAHGVDPGTVWHDRSPHTTMGPLLEALAVLEPARPPHLDTGWLSDSGHSGLTVAVLGRMGEADRPALRRMRQHSTAALAVVLDTAQWAGPSPREASPREPAPLDAERGDPGAFDQSSPASTPAAEREVGWLTSLGWRAVPLAPRDRLASAWRDLARGTKSSASVSQPAGAGR